MLFQVKVHLENNLFEKKFENLIMHKYEGDKEEPKMNEIIVYAQGE